mmetsp:Transcript_27607/g.31507  ORF Transcript_27607/g.31507 Transcript_27607/m.31507 type:complete len:856 (+) Transcript_27607:266-2833(+)
MFLRLNGVHHNVITNKCSFSRRRRRQFLSGSKISSISSPPSLVCFCLLLFIHQAQHSLAFTQPCLSSPPTLFSSNKINKKKPSALQISMTDVVDQLQLPLGFVKQIQVPFGEFSRQVSDNLDIGDALNRDVGNIPEAATSMVLDSIGKDLLVFLSASVLVTPICASIGITPILGYLLAGALLGSHGLDVFSNSKADVELGDFGILFLLFSEGLEVSTTRFRKLTEYLPLGLAQITLTAGVLTMGILLGAPFLEKFVTLDEGLININSPIEALVLALAGTLSTSAFVFPVLKDQGWEEEDSGQAATSILLLQDLLVAPLLVLLPFVVGTGNTDYDAIGFLTAKATLGFGFVIFLGSRILRQIFEMVAQAKSTETFVALVLLVSVGMGVIAKSLGLTDTVGAFAAGVLLANTNYRAQIQADILPFKGILLGIFFMDAGTSFNTNLVMTELPTILAGVSSLILLKASTMLLATRVPRWMEPNRLTPAEGIKVALLLAGGGEFAFVVLALAENLGVLPVDLGGLLTAIVLITMAVTPLLGQLADKVSKAYGGDAIIPTLDVSAEMVEQISTTSTVDATISTEVARNAIVVCGFGDAGRSTLQVLSNEYERMININSAINKMSSGDSSTVRFSTPPKLVAFDTDPSLVDTYSLISKDSALLFGDSSNPEVLKSSGISDPTAIFISYEEHGEVVSAASRLRAAFPTVPIYATSKTRAEAELIREAGANEVIVQQDKIPSSALITLDTLSKKAMEALQGSTIESPVTEVVASEEDDLLLEIYNSIIAKYSGGGVVDADGLANVLRKSNRSITSDQELDRMEAWIRAAVPGVNGKRPINEEEFCQLYRCSPPFVQETLSSVRS